MHLSLVAVRVCGLAAPVLAKGNATGCDLLETLCFENVDNHWWGVLIQFLVFAASIAGLAVVVHEYLLEALIMFTVVWGTAQDISGMILAAGSATPDVVINALAVTKSSSEAIDLGVGVVIGSGMLAFLLLPGLCCWFLDADALPEDRELAPWPMIRDTVTYGVALTLLGLALVDGSVDTVRAAVFVFVFGFYVLITVVVPRCSFMQDAETTDGDDEADPIVKRVSSSVETLAQQVLQFERFGRPERDEAVKDDAASETPGYGGLSACDNPLKSPGSEDGSAEKTGTGKPAKYRPFAHDSRGQDSWSDVTHADPESCGLACWGFVLWLLSPVFFAVVWLAVGLVNAWRFVFSWTIPRMFSTEDQRELARRSGPGGQPAERKADPGFCRGERSYPLTFVVAVVWVAIFAFVIITVAERWVAETGLNPGFVGILASLCAEAPNITCTLSAAHRGRLAMALANSFASQNLGLLLGLGLPWLLSNVAGERVVIEDPGFLREATYFLIGGICLGLCIWFCTLVLGNVSGKIQLTRAHGPVFVATYLCVFGACVVYLLAF